MHSVKITDVRSVTPSVEDNLEMTGLQQSGDGGDAPKAGSTTSPTGSGDFVTVAMLDLIREQLEGKFAEQLAALKGSFDSQMEERRGAEKTFIEAMLMKVVTLKDRVEQIDKRTKVTARPSQPEQQEREQKQEQPATPMSEGRQDGSGTTLEEEEEPEDTQDVHDDGGAQPLGVELIEEESSDVDVEGDDDDDDDGGNVQDFTSPADPPSHTSASSAPLLRPARLVLVESESDFSDEGEIMDDEGDEESNPSIGEEQEGEANDGKACGELKSLPHSNLGPDEFDSFLNFLSDNLDFSGEEEQNVTPERKEGNLGPIQAHSDLAAPDIQQSPSQVDDPTPTNSSSSSTTEEDSPRKPGPGRRSSRLKGKTQHGHDSSRPLYYAAHLRAHLAKSHKRPKSTTGKPTPPPTSQIGAGSKKAIGRPKKQKSSDPEGTSLVKVKTASATTSGSSSSRTYRNSWQHGYGGEDKDGKGKPRYFCVCGRSCISISALHFHILASSAVKLLHCHLCPEGSKQYSLIPLKYHMKAEHNVEYS